MKREHYVSKGKKEQSTEQWVKYYDCWVWKSWKNTGGASE